jgi:hypothetical protein
MDIACPILSKVIRAIAVMSLTVAVSATNGAVRADTVSLSPGPGTAIMVKDHGMKKIGPALAGLDSEYQAFLKKGGAAVLGRFSSGNPLLRVIHDTVLIDAVASGNAEDLLKDLAALGIRDPVVFGRYVSGRMPVAALKNMAAIMSLKFARPAYAILNAGSVTSQGDAAMAADLARSTFGVDGSGVTVGVLSDSFDCLGGAAADVANGDLPETIMVLDDSYCPNGTDEGRAIMQLIRDVAPGASQAFHTAFGGLADFAQGIIDLKDAGCKVIVDDVSYFGEPMFQDGIIAQAVDAVVASGAAYFSSAGNQARNSYEAPFRPSDTEVLIGGDPVGEAHDFDPGPQVDIRQAITVPVGVTAIFVLQWDSPFFSVSGGAGSPNDIDIYLTTRRGTLFLARSIEANIGGDPAEVLVFSNLGFGTEFNLMIINSAGPNPGLIKYVSFNSSVTVTEFAAPGGTCYGHANAAGAEAAGAAYYAETPAFGEDPALVEPFSSAGGVSILFDTLGNRLDSPQIRTKPGIVAPDGVNNTILGSDVDSDGFPNFFGTSAAAPHAGAVAALMIEAWPGLSPTEIYDALETTAADMDDPNTPGFDAGFDFATGFGLIRADQAVQAVVANTCPGDLDRDGDVDGLDLAAFTVLFQPGPCPSEGRCNGDLDGNDLVDTSDAAEFAANFGRSICP